MQALLRSLWEALPEDSRGREYFEKFNGAPPAELAQQLFALLDPTPDAEGRNLALVPVFHAPVKEIFQRVDAEGEDVVAGPDGRKWPFHYREDDLKAENLGRTKFGGVPHLPELLAHYGRRDDFVCQIDCSFLSAFDVRGLLPTSGWLWFWHSTVYMENCRHVARYWNGDRSELQPRLQNEIEAKPVYFVTGMARSGENAPLFFDFDTDGMGAIEQQLRQWQGHSAVNACVTLLCIRNCRDSALSRLPRDIVRLIAKDYVFPNFRETPREVTGPWWVVYSMCSKGDEERNCAYNNDGAWDGAVTITGSDARQGKWHNALAQGSCG
jgi:hypothetical protein